MFGLVYDDSMPLAARYPSAKFEALLRMLAEREPTLPIKVALDRLDAQAMCESPGQSMLHATMQERAEFAAEDRTIRDFLVAGQMINAIKELRAATELGLKESKDACELARQLIKEGWMSRAELAIAEKEAIASILGNTA